MAIEMMTAFAASVATSAFEDRYSRFVANDSNMTRAIAGFTVKIVTTLAGPLAASAFHDGGIA